MANENHPISEDVKAVNSNGFLRNAKSTVEVVGVYDKVILSEDDEDRKDQIVVFKMSISTDDVVETGIEWASRFMAIHVKNPEVQFIVEGVIDNQRVVVWDKNGQMSLA